MDMDSETLMPCIYGYIPYMLIQQGLQLPTILIGDISIVKKE